MERIAVMSQEWHHLLFLHWEVPAVEVQRLVPHGLTVDLFEGKAWVGLIPFTLTGLASFHEVNVRTYVHREGRDPGVWFFSLDASSGLAVEAARLAYKLPYYKAAIDFAASKDPLPTIDFTSHRDDKRGPTPAHAHIRYQPQEGSTITAKPDTQEQFLIERYTLYARDNDLNLWRARVEHAPYPIQRVEVHELDETLIWATGIRRPADAPLRHYSRGVKVKIYAPERVP